MLTRTVILIFYSTVVLKFVDCEIYRLSKNVKPIRYILTIEPFLDEGFYCGSVIIEIKILEITNNVTLHKKGIDVAYNDIKIVSSSGVEIQINDTSENKVTETYTIVLKDDLLENNHYNLTIGNFSRYFAHKKGFFLKRLSEDFGKTYTSIAATHFEPTSARLAFPCFDEPGLKTKFLISIIRTEGYHSVSNEALVKTQDLGDGRFKDTFKETPIMPTYTVAFIVSNFKSIENGKHRIFGLPKTIESGELDRAMEVGIKALQALEDFTGINYTLSKIDQFVVPQFPIPGMENWGLITYKERLMKINNKCEARELQLMTLLVSHEFAHQWFGNLVTPEWWNFLWLSEALAVYFQYYIASIVQRSWQLMDQFVIDEVQKALYLEEFREVGALNDHIKHSGDLPLLHIMYFKGSSIIRMTEHFLTHGIFRNGLQIYLQNKKFSAATPSDLYSALQQALDNAGASSLLGGMSVADILTTWDSTNGFPIVTVTRNYTSGSVTLTQSSAKAQPRIIPINYVFSTANEPDFSKTKANYWLTGESAVVDNNFPIDGWVIANKQQTGYYRVNYDLENWERLITFLNNNNFLSIHVVNRAQLIDDAFYMAYHKVIPWHISLRLSEYLIRERNYIPFAAFSNSVDRYIFPLFRSFYEGEYDYFQNYSVVNTISTGASLRKLYKEYIFNVLSGIREYLGPEPKPDDTHLEKLNRWNLRFLY